MLRVLYRLLWSKLVTTALTVLLLGTLEVDGEKAAVWIWFAFIPDDLQCQLKSRV
jgi:hypothetical protein